MAVPYKIIAKKDSSFDEILQRKITHYRFIAKNEKANGKKTVQLDKCLDEKGNRIYTIDEPKGIEKKENQNQLKKIKTIKRKWEARRDALVNPLSWRKLVIGKVEEKKQVDKDNLNYYDLIDKVWGINSHRQRDTIKSVIRIHFPMLYEGTLKEVINPDTNNDVIEIFDKMYTGEILSTRYKNQKPFGHRTLKWYWKHYHRINRSLQKKNYVSDIYSDGNRPSLMDKPIPVKLKGKATEEEVRAIYDLDFSTYKYQDIRRCFLWSTMFTGMRFTTMSQLKWKNIEEKENNEVKIYLENQTKTDIELIQFHKKDKYWDEFVGERGDDEDFVFNLPKLENGDVDNSYIAESFKWALKKNKIYRKGLTPKMCRHTCAYRMLKATDSDIYRVSKHLGHKDVKTTQQNYVREGDDFYKKSSNYLSDIDRFFVPDSV